MVVAIDERADRRARLGQRLETVQVDTYQYRVEKLEDIRTLAGAFQTVKVSVHVEGNWNGPYRAFRQESVMYFAPVAKVFVRISTREHDSQGTTTYFEELTSYKVTTE